MNTFALVLLTPTMLTLGSAGTLFFSFKGQVDSSGRFFLLAELLMLFVLLLVMATNIYPYLAIPTVFYVSNLSLLVAEVAILLSIKLLSEKVNFQKFIFGVFLTAIYCGVIEYSRSHIDPKLPILFLSIFSMAITIATFIACKAIKGNGLDSNLFIKWIAYSELGLTGIHLLRLLSYFSDVPMLPRNPSTPQILVFSIYLTFNLFRYISYQSLRISWVNPSTMDENSLNRNLVKLIKEKNQFLQGLMSSNRAIGISALANSLAHQLSQPITGVILQTEIVKRDLIELSGQTKSVDALNTITLQLGRLSGLVNNLRRLFSNHGLDFKTFNIQEACDEILEVIEPTLQSKNITLIKQYNTNPAAYGNITQIQQVLINIFNNAIDAILSGNNPDRNITLSITDTSDFAVISIKDSGTGIPTKAEASMFELYQSTKKEGLGIGLWLSKTIIDKHNGSIHASNDKHGGAIFEIRIPLATRKI